jgi:hypothetical protein
MNGLQSLTQWQEAFNHPSGSMLGLLNAIQVGNFALITSTPPDISHAVTRILARWEHIRLPLTCLMGLGDDQRSSLVHLSCALRLPSKLLRNP